MIRCCIRSDPAEVVEHDRNVHRLEAKRRQDGQDSGNHHLYSGTDPDGSSVDSVGSSPDCIPDFVRLQFANDEADYGMGLELGHDLLHS